MSLDKISKSLEALDHAMSILDKSLELGQQTGRFRNIIGRNDMDAVVAITAAATKLLVVELTENLQEEA